MFLFTLLFSKPVIPSKHIELLCKWFWLTVQSILSSVSPACSQSDILHTLQTTYILRQTTEMTKTVIAATAATAPAITSVLYPAASPRSVHSNLSQSDNVFISISPVGGIETLVTVEDTTVSKMYEVGL